MKKLAIWLAAVTLAGAAPLAAAGGDPAAGRAKAEQVCGACHGVNGDKPSAPDQPILAGQWDDYIATALKEYKTGKRSNPIMKGFAATLSEQDIENVAAWFSSRPSRLGTKR